MPIVLIVCDESGRYGPCYVIRKRERGAAHTYVWEWLAWARTRAEAESYARSHGTLIGYRAPDGAFTSMQEE
jgi:hypothetical protein